MTFLVRPQLTSSDDRSIKIFSVTSHDTSFSIAEKKQLFGHTARVFVTKAINFEGTKFVSAGEDSNVCVWDEDGALLSKRNVSASGTLWDFDFDETSQTIVTSSSTGVLNRFNLSEVLFEDRRVESFSSKAHAAKLNFLENGNLVVLDSQMKLHLRKGNEWHAVEQPETDEKFVAMTVRRNRLFIAGKHSISVFDFDEQPSFVEMIEIAAFLPTTLSLCYLRAIHATGHDEVCVSDLKGLCLVFNINHKKLLNAFQIPKSSEPWTTAMARINGSWLIADRVGNLFLYGNDPTLPSEPTHKIWRLHGQLGVTTISVGDNGFIRTTGSDGNVKTLFFNQTASPPTLEVHRSEKTALNWIEKVSKWAGKYFLLGFNDNYFGIYRNRQIVHEHRCGGRQRHWDVTYEDDSKKVNLVYILRKQLHSVEFKLSEFAFDADDMTWHTKDCNALVVCSDLLITGGEDTLLKITRVGEVDGQLQFQEVATLNSHNSSIKDFSVTRDGDDLLIFSSGGRSQIAVNRLIVKSGDVKEEVNFHFGSTKGFVPMASTFDPEMRFTSLHYDIATCNLFVACSDGFIRVFKCKRDDAGALSLETSIEHFYGLCVLKVHVIERDVLVSMATDGFVCFWRHDESTKALGLIDRLKHNQSGINCYDIYRAGEGRFVIGTSGDDTGIFVTEFSLGDGRIAFGETISSHEVHTAQVTGLKFRTSDTFYTTSVDQTVCQLQLTPTAIVLVARKFTCISDVKGFEVLKDKQIVVFGAGLEVLTSF